MTPRLRDAALCACGCGTEITATDASGRRAVLIELNEAYCQLIARRTQQQSLFA